MPNLIPLPAGADAEGLKAQIARRLPLHDDEDEGWGKRELGPSMPIWSVDLERGCLRDSGRWQHLVRENGRTTFLAESRQDGEQLRVDNVRRLPTASAFDEALARLAERDREGRRDIRVVRVPSHQLIALWLHLHTGANRAHPGNDPILTVIVPRGFAHLHGGVWYTGSTFLDALRSDTAPVGVFMNPTGEETSSLP